MAKIRECDGDGKNRAVTSTTRIVSYASYLLIYDEVHLLRMLVNLCPRIWVSSALCEDGFRARRRATRNHASNFSISADAVTCACRIGTVRAVFGRYGSENADVVICAYRNGKVPSSVPADAKTRSAAKIHRPPLRIRVPHPPTQSSEEPQMGYIEYAGQY